MDGIGAVTVFFDGLCPVCRREVRWYRRLHAPGAIRWRDLAGDDDVLRDEPFDLAQALTLLHVRDRDGMLRVGLDAHLVLWRELPVFRVLASIVRRSTTIRRLLSSIYVEFTRRRPGLHRRRLAGAACRD